METVVKREKYVAVVYAVLSVVKDWYNAVMRVWICPQIIIIVEAAATDVEKMKNVLMASVSV